MDKQTHQRIFRDMITECLPCAMREAGCFPLRYLGTTQHSIEMPGCTRTASTGNCKKEKDAEGGFLQEGEAAHGLAVWRKP